MKKNILLRTWGSSQNFIAYVAKGFPKGTSFRPLRRNLAPFGAAIILLVFFLVNVLKPASAGVIPVTFDTVILNATGSTSGGVADTASDNGAYFGLQDKKGSLTLDVDFSKSAATPGQAAKMYRVDFTIDAKASLVDNYYVKMYSSAGNAFQDFGDAYISNFSPANVDKTVTKTILDPAKARDFFNNGFPRVKILNGKSYNSGTDNGQSWLYIDFLEVKFYEDVTPPVIGPLSISPGGAGLTGTQTITLSSVTDAESGMQVVDFVYTEKGIGNWRSMTSPDTTPDADNSYSVAWDTTQVPDGEYEIKAVAYDKVNNAAETQPLTVTVQNTADTIAPYNVYLQSPVTGSRVNNPTLIAHAEDNIGVTKVEFYYNNPLSIRFFEDTDPADGWSALWDTSFLEDGQSYELWVKAYDAFNNVTVSNPNIYIVDKTPPVVEGTEPTHNSANVPTSRPPIKAFFSETMDWSTINNTTFTVVYDSGSIPGVITGDDAAKAATFIPAVDLPAEKWLTATLTPGARDLAGNSLATPYTWQFYTVDTSPPEVLAISPAEGASLKKEQRTITAMAQDNVAVTKVEFFWQDSLAPNGWYKFGADTTGADGWTAILDTSQLPHDGPYEIKAVAYDAKYPQNPPGEKVVRYTVDNTLLQVLPFSLTPADGERGVSLRPVLKATFSEEIDFGTLLANSTTYLTRWGSPEVINTNLEYQAATRTLTMTLPEGMALDYNSTYTAHITTGVTDLAGNPLEGPFTWSFTTIADLLAPQLSQLALYPQTISPRNGDGRNDEAAVSFDLDEEANVHLEVYNAVGEKVYQSPALSFTAGSGRLLTWKGQTGSGAWAPDGAYTLYLQAVDPAGNIARKSFLDKVTVDNYGPLITQAEAESRTKIKISFNEAMDPVTATNKFFYSVSETDNPLVTLEVYQVIQLDAMNFLIETLLRQRTDRTSYTVTVNNLEDKAGNVIQSPSRVDFTGFNPHGLYGSSTSLCSTCHLTHNAQGSQLVNSAKVKLLCYACHNGGGESSYNAVKSEFQKNSHHPVEIPSNGGGLISCEDCHNVHGDQAAPGVLLPKLLRSQNSVTGQVYNQGNEYCWACHGSVSTLPQPNGDKETYYPADGSVHNNADWEDPQTKIRCTKCHENHGSDRVKLIPSSVTFRGNTVELSSVGNCVCCACHNQDPQQANYNFNGRAVYADSARNPHYSQRCVVCHDPHSQQIGKLLKRTFPLKPGRENVSGATYIEDDFTWDNVQTCVGCHTGTHARMPDITNKFKEYDVLTETYKIPTTFWQESLWDPGNYDPRTNLHDYHLNLKNYKPGYGNITCKECHRPHGSLAEENPNGFSRTGNPKSRMVGFPMRGPRSVEAYAYAQPVWKVIDIEGQPAGGTCNLVCHGKVHDDVTYLAGEPPPPAVNKDGSCYSCHGNMELPNPMEIQSLMGSWEQPGSGLASHHIVANVDKDLSGNNNCLTECHKPHSQINYYANNTIQDPGWDPVNKVMSNDPALCQNTYCHVSNQTVPDPKDPSGHIAPSITSQFSQTLHGKMAGSGQPYETVYHDYDVSIPGQGQYKGNCLKCHNPHGTSKPKLLDFKPGSTLSGSTSFTGNDNSVCDLCHLNGLANTPNYAGKTLYNQTAHGGLLKSGKTENYCNDCHDPHGREDSLGLIPNMLKIRGTAGCYDCHDGYKPITPGWTGSIGYNTGAHQIYAHDGNAERNTGYCEVCHAVHGKDDGSGSPVRELLWKKEEGSCFLPGASGTACHGTGGRSALNGNKNIDIQSLYSKSYRHGNLNDSGKHNSGERTMPNLNRHAECEDCHNSHSAKATPRPSQRGTNAVKPSSVNVWGITPAEPWPVPAPGSLASPASWNVVENAQYEWQICFKCHSKWAYGSSPPPSTTWSGAAATQTDTPAEFNPNNYGHHAVIAQGKNQPGSYNPNFADTFVAPWGPASTLACSDCHASDNSKPDATGEALGTHGSNFKYLLVKNITGAGTPEVFCFNCHKREVYADIGYTAPQANYSRWTHPDNSNHASPSTNHISGIWCLNCHMGATLGGSHGSNAGPGPDQYDATYTKHPLGKRLMNGASIISYNTKAGGIACYTGTSNALTACSKGHRGQRDTTNYDYLP